MAIPLTTNQQAVSSFYLAYYGRPADVGGLAYWTGILEQAGGDMGSIVDAFANSPESTARFGAMTPAQQIANIYQQLLGRDPEPAGADYWQGEITAGRMTIAQLAINIHGGARDQDAIIVNARQQVANQFTAALPADGTGYGGSAAIEAGRLIIQATTSTTSNADITALVNAGTMLTANATSNPAVITALTGPNGHLTDLLGTPAGAANPLALVNLVNTIVTTAAGNVASLNALLGTSGSLTDAVTSLPAGTTLTGLDSAIVSGGFAAGAVVLNPPATDGGDSTPPNPPVKSLAYSATTFNESADNDGSITENITITLTNDTFTGTNGQVLAGATVNNVPAGLSAVVTKISATTAVISFTGTATQHEDANDIANLEVVLANGAFTGGSAAAVTNATKSGLVIDFTPTTFTVTNTGGALAFGGNATGAITFVVDAVSGAVTFTRGGKEAADKPLLSEINSATADSDTITLAANVADLSAANATQLKTIAGFALGSSTYTLKDTAALLAGADAGVLTGATPDGPRGAKAIEVAGTPTVAEIQAILTKSVSLAPADLTYALADFSVVAANLNNQTTVTNLPYEQETQRNDAKTAAKNSDIVQGAINKDSVVVTATNGTYTLWDQASHLAGAGTDVLTGATAIYVDGALTNDNFADLKTITEATTSIVTATITDTAANLKTLETQANNAITMQVSGGAAAAADLLALVGKTSVAIDAASVATITGTAADIAAVVASTSISKAANFAATVSGELGNADLAHLTAITTATSGIVTASITDTAAHLVTLETQANNAITMHVSGGAEMADLLALVGKTSVNIDAALVTSITGSAGADTIDLSATNITYSSSAAMTITGGAGSDTITLRAGAVDTIVFNDLAAADVISGFVVNQDFIQLSKGAGMGNLAVEPGNPLDTGFASIATGGDAATNTNWQAIVYFQDTGKLYYNADAATAGGLTLIGTFDAGTALTAANFTVIA